MPFSDLDDQIRDLCTRVTSARGPDELTTVCAELRAALQEHMRQTRDLATRTLQGIDDSRRRTTPRLQTPTRKPGK